MAKIGTDLPFSIEMWILRRIYIQDNKVALIPIGPYPIGSAWAMDARGHNSRQVSVLFNMFNNTGGKASLCALQPITHVSKGHVPSWYNVNLETDSIKPAGDVSCLTDSNRRACFRQLGDQWLCRKLQSILRGCIEYVYDIFSTDSQ